MKNILLPVVIGALPLSLFSQSYQITTPVTNLSYPVAFVFAPDGRYFITLKGGDTDPAVDAKVVVYSPSGTLIGTFYDLTDSTTCDFERGVLGICLDPDFNTNRYVYVYYNHFWNNDERIRVVRFTEVSNAGTNPLILLDIDCPLLPGNHVGGNLRFRPSDPNRLYVSIGDVADPPNSQMLNNPYGKILRINKDGTIPASNPFYDDGNPLTGNDDRIWSYGHRNPFDFCFSTVNDSLYCEENGAVAYDEVNYIIKGKNYGWPNCEGACSPPNPLYEDPIGWWTPTVGATGILFYSHTLFPQFNNHVLGASNNWGWITDFTLANPPLYNQVTTQQNILTIGGLTTLMQGSEGCIYAMTGGYVTNGMISRICPLGFSVGENTPAEFELRQNFPNPVSASTDIVCILSRACEVKLSLYDMTGKKISDLATGRKLPGLHLVQLDAVKLNLPAGNYLYRLEVTDGDEPLLSQTKKMTVVR